MPENPRWFSPPLYGLKTFGDLFTPRQLVALTTLSGLVGEAMVRIRTDAIETVELSGGRTTRGATIKGIIIGGLAGAALIGFGQLPEINPGFSDFMKGAPIGLAAGALVGGVVGYALGGERWVPATMPR